MNNSLENYFFISKSPIWTDNKNVVTFQVKFVIARSIHRDFCTNITFISRFICARINIPLIGDKSPCYSFLQNYSCRSESVRQSGKEIDAHQLNVSNYYPHQILHLILSKTPNLKKRHQIWKFHWMHFAHFYWERPKVINETGDGLYYRSHDSLPCKWEPFM